MLEEPTTVLRVIEMLNLVGGVIGSLEEFTPVLSGIVEGLPSDCPALVTLAGAVELVELQMRGAAVALEQFQTALH